MNIREETLRIARNLIEKDPSLTDWVISKFPELKESEDVKMKNFICNELACLRATDEKGSDRYNELTEAIAWIEKQGAQKPVEPKIKKGDWVVVDGVVQRVREVKEEGFDTDLYWNGKDTFKDVHFWTLQDAKAGDVLAFDDNTIVIFKDLYNTTTFHSYCHVEEGAFSVSQDEIPDWWEGKGFYPATKEQCELLFQKMREAGYSWDAENKKLEKIKQEPLIEGTFVNVDEVRENFMREVYRVLDADPTNDRANQIIYAFDHLPTITIQNAEWSEEDEKMLAAFLNKVEVYDPLSNKESAWVLKKLKSIKPQSHWKPSERQLYDLYHVAQMNTESCPSLKSLYFDLKKLI